jgi:hypothetical protein
MRNASIFLWLGLASLASGPSPAGPEVAVLPESEASALAKQCSRPGPPAFEGTWTPTPAQVAALRQQLPRLVGMKANGCCLVGARIKALAGVRVQVVGLELAGSRRVLYLNGRNDSTAGESWRTKAWTVCDGGDGFWGVVFDPATGAFSGLAFNGIG